MKVTRREEEVREANVRAVMLNKPLKFELALTSAYFLGMNDRSPVVSILHYPKYVYMHTSSITELPVVKNNDDTYMKHVSKHST